MVIGAINKGNPAFKDWISRVGMILSFSAVLVSLALGIMMFIQGIIIPLWKQLNAACLYNKNIY